MQENQPRLYVTTLHYLQSQCHSQARLNNIARTYPGFCCMSGDFIVRESQSQVALKIMLLIHLPLMNRIAISQTRVYSVQIAVKT